ncbi:DEAD/DEAH box helicase [Gracilinema caldarium]|uniref:RNA helicase n=1 Tax=Gracilinema caldarium (strain ATCC 51460 / DSM 7334 / H1) TaxID=744872 RepID=F8EXS0_GRAC1|nr:DEAD/DEAH box helicase [Gracilinema caldarium]AEJ20084.1 DEAD/DEAH box helicase domain protein [Gracilinema caldarium DSM 7334]
MTTTNTLTFDDFGLSERVLSAVKAKGFIAPSSIQALALPRLLADEGHLIAKARTGTGKTAAFGIPLVERLTTPSQKPKALILTPTRELALQVAQEIKSLAGGPFPRIAAVYGGASIGPQLRDLNHGVEIVVGTPGRVMDHLDRGSLDLSEVDWFILDEADEMLDMGFFEDVEAILSKTKSDRRVALFSATMPDAILALVKRHIGEFDIVEDKASLEEKPAVDQYYLLLRKEDRLEALRRIIDGADDFYGLVFCATKAETDELARRLVENGYGAEAIHGDLSQEGRERTLRRFRSRMTTILVATDVAARGIDVERLTHVINWDLPNDRETYVHRIGRTGRAGRRGIAISFVLPAARGRITQLSRSMEKVLGSPIQKMPIPSVPAVMTASQKRVIQKIIAAVQGLGDQMGSEQGEGFQIDALPTGSSASLFPANDPRSLVADELIQTLGERRAIEALVAAAYGNELDPSRYGPIVELQDRPVRGTDRGSDRGRSSGRFSDRFGGDTRNSFRERDGRNGAFRSSEGPHRRAAGDRVYIGVGRRHGVSARDVAGLLMRAGGVPGRLVDAIEVRDYCAYATLPAEAARRAYDFAKRDPEHPTIKPAGSRNS